MISNDNTTTVVPGEDTAKAGREANNDDDTLVEDNRNVTCTGEDNSTNVDMPTQPEDNTDTDMPTQPEETDEEMPT